MSVMTPEQLRNGGSGVDMRGRPITPGAFQPAPVTPPAAMARAAVVDQLGAPPPIASGGSPFNRGGVVKQLPSSGVGGKIADVGAQVSGQIANQAMQTSARSGAGGAIMSFGTDLAAKKLRVKEEMPTFGGEFGAYTDDAGRRFQGTGGGIASNAVKWAGVGANPGLMAATGGLSVAAGALGGAIKGAITKHAPSAYTDFKVEDAQKAIKAQYKAELGREASDEEVMGALKGQGWNPDNGSRWVGEKNLIGKGGVMEQIRNSPEAQAFKASGVPGGQAAASRAAVVDQLGAPPPGAAPPVAPGSAPAGPGSTAPGSAPSGPLASPALAGRGGVPAPRAGAPSDVTGGTSFDPANPWAGHPGGAAPPPTVDNAGTPDWGEYGGLVTPDLHAQGLHRDASGGLIGMDGQPAPGRGGATPPAAPGGAVAPGGGGPPSDVAGAGAPAADLGDASGWDTDGYDAPQYVPKEFGQAPEGFDQTKWNDPNHQTPKYAVSRILNQFGGTPQGVEQAMPDLQKAYPGATFNGKDKVTIPGLGTIDVVRAAGDGGKGLQWIPDGGGDAGAPGDPSAPTRTDGGPDYGADEGGLLARLQAEIARIQSGAPDRKALIAQLGEEAA